MGVDGWGGSLRILLLLAMLVAAALRPAHAAGAAAPAEAVPREGEGAPARDGSVLLSASKATTFKIGSVLTNLLVLTTATGPVGGVALTAFNTVESWLVYTANDYLWDTYSPKEANSDGTFDAEASAWRTTKKFITYKPIVAGFKYASIYVWTGSLPLMLTVGTLSVLSNTAVFYVNNFGWDLYEWSHPPAPVAPPGPMAPGQPIAGLHAAAS